MSPCCVFRSVQEPSVRAARGAMSVHLPGDAEPLPQWNALPVVQPGQPPGPHLPQPQVTQLAGGGMCQLLVAIHSAFKSSFARARLSAVVISCPVYPRRCSSFRSCGCSSSATTSCVRSRPPSTPSHTYDSWYDFHAYPHTHTQYCTPARFCAVIPIATAESLKISQRFLLR